MSGSGWWTWVTFGMRFARHPANMWNPCSTRLFAVWLRATMDNADTRPYAPGLQRVIKYGGCDPPPAMPFRDMCRVAGSAYLLDPLLCYVLYDVARLGRIYILCPLRTIPPDSLITYPPT